MNILVTGFDAGERTKLARALASRLGAICLNGEDFGANFNRDLGASPADRIEHVRRLGWLCQRIAESGHRSVADCVFLSAEAQRAFAPDFVIWVDGPEKPSDANFDPARGCDVRVTPNDSAEEWAARICERLQKG